MIRIRTVLLGLGCLGAAACASRGAASDPETVSEVPFASAADPQGAPEALPTSAPTAPPAPAACSSSKVPGTLARADVVAVVEQGLGRWLGGIAVSAVRDEQDRFVGWRIDAIADPCYRGVGLEPGDVVTRVNGAALTTPERTNQIFVGLRSAPALQVELVRGGNRRTLSWSIAGP